MISDKEIDTLRRQANFNAGTAGTPLARRYHFLLVEALDELIERRAKEQKQETT